VGCAAVLFLVSPSLLPQILSEERGKGARRTSLISRFRLFILLKNVSASLLLSLPSSSSKSFEDGIIHGTPRIYSTHILLKPILYR
jgi:hypothetical protein